MQTVSAWTVDMAAKRYSEINQNKLCNTSINHTVLKTRIIIVIKYKIMQLKIIIKNSHNKHYKYYINIIAKIIHSVIKYGVLMQYYVST